MANVSVITPCRNEEKFIGKCLDSIINNVFPKEKMEVLVIDGRSTDRTRGIIEAYAKKHHFIKLMDNPGIIQTLATNIGIKASNGNVVIRMDAHAEYPTDYISKLVHSLETNKVDCVGGLWITKPGRKSPVAETIALALSHPFGVGNAHYRIGIKEPRHVDTVPYGCYRKEVFDKVGLFNENLNRTDDIEFNLRLKRAGGKILLVPEIFSYYYARSNLADLAKQNFGNGFWVLYSLRFVKLPFSLRHLVPFFFVSSLLGSLVASFLYQPVIYLFAFILGLYFCINVLVSCKLSLKHGVKYFPLLVIAFLTLHVSYGLGSLWGIVKLFLHRQKPENQKSEVRGSEARGQKSETISLAQRFLKRSFDILASTFGLILTGWIIVLAYIAASIDTKGSGFFTQERIGKRGVPFKVIKIRTMRDIPSINTTVTALNDPRITPLGRFLRKTKIDEIPQLINVFLGQMSFVGPRPDVAGYADRLTGEDRVILTIRPGVTGPATLKYRNEEELLAGHHNPEKYNDEVIFPDKVRLNKEYVVNYSFWKDIEYIYRTIFRSQKSEVRGSEIRDQRIRDQRIRGQKSEVRTAAQIRSRKCRLNLQKILSYTKKRLPWRWKYSELAKIGQTKRSSR